ncbi:MAG: hypothetical protein LQ351_005398 [Letrouitia transgressa]|nr:MAG: hypothetical protein LQ351_005398 [Letrouitia transgressa]
MHSTLVRAQNVFGFFTTVAFCTAALVALSVSLFPQEPSAKVDLRNVQVVKGRPHYYSPKKEEYAHIKFDLDADFTSLFNWNTKQLFVWITATYPASASSPESPPSQSIIWDAIINSETQKNPLNPLAYFSKPAKAPQKSTKTRKSSLKSKDATEGPPGIIQLRNSRPKYQITDISGKLSARSNVTLEVGWNVQPWVGALTWTLADGQRWGRWKGLRGGRSISFDMPEIKVKGVNSDAVKGSGKPEKVAEASPILK